MANIAGFKQYEVVDGLRCSIMAPMGNNFQLGGEWSLSNSKGANFDFTSAINNHSGNPYQSQDEI